MKRNFTKAQLIEWGVANKKSGKYYYEPPEIDDESNAVVADVHLCNDEYEEVRARVFRAPDDGLLWRIQYEKNDNAPCDEMNEDELGAWTVAELVEAKTRTITVYEAV